MRLQELRNWLITCKYPVALIYKNIKNAKLQGSAPEPTKKDSISYATTHHDNYDVRNISTTSVSLLHNYHNSRINNVFKDCKIVTAFCQPRNLLLRLISSKFSSARWSILIMNLFYTYAIAIGVNYVEKATSLIVDNFKQQKTTKKHGRLGFTSHATAIMWFTILYVISVRLQPIVAKPITSG